MRILGIDPGLAIVGFGIIDKNRNGFDVVDYGVITKAGAWFSYGELRLGQGKDAARVYLQENPELSQEIQDKIKEEIAKNGMKNSSKKINTFI